MAVDGGEKHGWFGVKLIFETRIESEITSLHEERVIEERVLLIRARDFDHAVARAEDEAKDYTGIPAGRNQLGEALAHSYLGACNVFSIADSPGDLVEVFSSMRLCSRSAEDDVVEVLLGSDRDTSSEQGWVRFEPFEAD